MTIRVLLAEDQPIVRAGFRALLDAEADLEVAGEAADGREAVALAHAAQSVPAGGRGGSIPVVGHLDVQHVPFDT